MAQLPAARPPGAPFNNQIVLSATTAGPALNGAAVTVTNDAATGAETAAYSTAGNTLTVHSNAASTTAQIVGAINATGVFSASTTSSGVNPVEATTTNNVTSGGGLNNIINLNATKGGTAYNNATVVINQNAATGAETAAYNAGTNTLTIHSNANSDTAQLVTAINAEGTFSASTAGAGLGTYAAGTLSNVTTGGATGSSAVSDLQINQADFGTASQLGIQVNIDQQAKQAQLIYSGGAVGLEHHLAGRRRQGIPSVQLRRRNDAVAAPNGHQPRQRFDRRHAPQSPATSSS